MEDGVFQFDWAPGVQVDAIGFGGDHDLAALGLLAVRVGLIEIMDRVQTPYRRLFDIPHAMVRMQGLLEAQRVSPCIRYYEFEAQLRAERDAVHETKFARPPFPRALVAFGKHADRDRVPDLGDRLELPRLRPHEA